MTLCCWGLRCRIAGASAFLSARGFLDPLDLHFDHDCLNGFKPATPFPVRLRLFLVHNTLLMSLISRAPKRFDDD